MLDAFGVVQVEDLNRCATDRCLAEDHGSGPCEVNIPHILARIEERSQSAALWVESGQIARLAEIARHAGEREVAEDRAAAMLPGDDVLNVQRPRVIGLRHPAVLAAVLRSLVDASVQVASHAPSGILAAGQ